MSFSNIAVVHKWTMIDFNKVASQFLKLINFLYTLLIINISSDYFIEH